MAISAPSRPAGPKDPNEPDVLDAVIEEARRRARRRRRRYAVLFVLAAGGAAAVLAAERGGGSDRAGITPSLPSGASATPQQRVHVNGALTLIAGRGVEALGRDARGTLVFRCRPARHCYDLESIAWSPDGRTLAFSVTTVGASSHGYNGIHLYDPATRRDRQISSTDGFSLAWSPDGTRIAYIESSVFPSVGTIAVIDADGSQHRIVPTSTSGSDMSPSWSPDGRRLVYAIDANALTANRHRAISISDIDGSHERLLAKDASWPSWSPDGRTIAYHARCGGTKLITPSGVDATPGSRTCLGIGPAAGTAVWSPDSHKLAIANRFGVYEVDLRRPSAPVRLLTSFAHPETGLGVFGSGQPSWRPGR